MGEATQTRRARLRAETSSEIKAIALAHMAAEGPAAISLRAVAREMGMTAGAIYSYFDTRDELVSALVADVYDSLAERLENARDAVPAADPTGRVIAVGHTYREWAVAHPEEFRLVYGDPAPGYVAPDGGAAADAEKRACTVILDLVAAAWPKASSIHTTDNHQWTDFVPAFADAARTSFPKLPPAAVALGIRVWGRMHGLVALEVYGHLRNLTQDPGKLYRAELHDLVATLGLEPPTEPEIIP